MSTEPRGVELGATLVAAARDGAPQRVTWRQWYMAVVLTLLYIYAVIDRGALALLVGPIKQDLGMTDTQMSLLLGTSFAAFYAILGLPAGYLVDRVSRRGIMGVGIVLWSCMTMSCGLAQTYWQLFLGRCGVGIGEAAISPASYSLIRDSFPPDKRGRAFGVFAAGAYIGSAGAVILTGFLIQFISSGSLGGVPIIGTMRTWQAVLVVIGMAGLPLSLLVLTFREAPRRADGSLGTAGVAFGEAFDHIKTRWRTYLPLVTYATCCFAVSVTYAAWMPTVVIRTWHLPPQQIGVFFGTTLLIGAPIGSWAGGAAIDRLVRRGRAGASALVGTWLVIAFIPFGVTSPIAPSVDSMWITLAIQLLVAGAYQPVAATILSQIAPQRLMGKITSIYLLISTLLGLGLGPTLAATISDNFFSGPQALGDALSVTTGGLMTLALAMIALLLRQARRRPPASL